MKKTILLFLLILTGILAKSQHVVQLKSGEKMNGTVQSFNKGIVEFLYKGNVMKINVSDLYSINFAEQGESLMGEKKSAFKGEPGEKQLTNAASQAPWPLAE